MDFKAALGRTSVTLDLCPLTSILVRVTVSLSTRMTTQTQTDTTPARPPTRKTHTRIDRDARHTHTHTRVDAHTETHTHLHRDTAEPHSGQRHGHSPSDTHKSCLHIVERQHCLLPKGHFRPRRYQYVMSAPEALLDGRSTD